MRTLEAKQQGKSGVGHRKGEGFCGAVFGGTKQSPLPENAGNAQYQAGVCEKFAHTAFADGSEVHSDGYCSYIPARDGFTHKHKPYDPDFSFLHWLHIVISNTKALIIGTYHGLSKKYLQSYLDEYSFRFCRCNFGPTLLERLTLAVSLSRLANQKG